MESADVRSIFSSGIKMLKVVIKLLMGSSSQSYRASPAVWDHNHSVLSATRHRWTRPALTPAR